MHSWKTVNDPAFIQQFDFHITEKHHYRHHHIMKDEKTWVNLLAAFPSSRTTLDEILDGGVREAEEVSS